MEEKESFRLRGGVRTLEGSVIGGWPSIGFGVLVKAGPRRFTAGELRFFNAWRLVLTLPEPPELSIERGVKNFLNDRGVTVGGLFGLRRRPASDAIDGGEEGMISCSDAGRTGSDLEKSDRAWRLSIMH